MPEAHPSEGDHNGGSTRDTLVSSSLAHFVAGSEGLITKRIDLAVLEGQELLSRTLRRAAFVAFAVALAVAAWFALAASLILVVDANAKPVVRLAAFGLLNASGALGLLAIAIRNWSRPAARARANESSPAGE